MDKISPELRHYNMSRIHGKDTRPEILVRKFLFSKGLRYRKNDKRLPGHPDIVLSKYKTVIFVNGCFWHGHENCKYCTIPVTNTEFWKNKILSNKRKDSFVHKELMDSGWKVITIWTCEIRNQQSKAFRLNQLYEEIISIHGS